MIIYLLFTIHQLKDTTIMQRGKFITLEGPEGAGKTTQISCIAQELINRDYRVLTTREPGGSPGAEEIRQLLLNGSINKWDGMTEALLNAAARRNHLQETIEPALAQGTWVLCDRFTDSTIAYQAFGRGVERELIQQLMQLAIGDCQPDLTIMLMLEPAIGLQRTQKRGEQNRYEAMQLKFHQAVYEGFQWLAAHDGERIVALSVKELAREEVTALVMREIEQRLMIRGR